MAVTLLLGIICRRGPLRFQGNETWRFTKPCMNNMLRLSTPTALERMALSLAQIVMTSVVAGMGTVAVASNYVYSDRKHLLSSSLRRRLRRHPPLWARASEPGGWIWQSGSPTEPRS